MGREIMSLRMLPDALSGCPEGQPSIWNFLMWRVVLLCDRDEGQVGGSPIRFKVFTFGHPDMPVTRPTPDPDPLL